MIMMDLDVYSYEDMWHGGGGGSSHSYSDIKNRKWQAEQLEDGRYTGSEIYDHMLFTTTNYYETEEEARHDVDTQIVCEMRNEQDVSCTSPYDHRGFFCKLFNILAIANHF